MAMENSRQGGGQCCVILKRTNTRYGGRYGTWWITERTWTAVLVCLIVLCGGGVLAQIEPNPNSGPCESVSSPCITGERYGDPLDCTKYYECVDSSLTLLSCADGILFDIALNECSGDDANQCSPPCDSSPDKADEVNSDNPENEVPADSVLPGEGNIGDESDSPGSNSTLPDTDVESGLTVPPVTGAGKNSPEPDDGGDILLPPDGSDNSTLDEVTSSSTTIEIVTSPPTKSTFGPPVEIGTSDPPYTVFVTVTRPPPAIPTTTTPASSTPNGTGDGDTDEVKKGGLSPIMITVIAAVGAAFIMLIIIIIIVICMVRRKRRRKHDIVRIENPRYIKEDNGPRDYRFSGDSSLLLRTQPPKNNNLHKSNMNAKKKRPPPPAPVQKKSTTPSKRKAPPPPNPFTGELEDNTPRQSNDDLYEKDTEGGSVESLEMTTFSAPTVVPGDTADEEEFDSTEEQETNPGDALLDEEQEKGGEEEEENANHSSPNGEIKLRDTEQVSDNESSSSAEEENPKEEDDAEEEEEEIQEDEKGLLENEENLSGDSYDKLNNPFYQ